MFLLSPLWACLCAISAFQWLLLLGLLGLFIWWKMMAPFNQYSEIPQVAPHWFLGNESFGGISFSDTYLNHYKALGDHRFGIFWEGNKPAIFLKDLDLIKKVQITDADSFLDLGFGDNWYNEKVGNVFGLASLTGEPWKKMKRLTTPPFSVPRLKKTVPAMNECGQKLRLYMEKHENDEFVDGLDFSRKFFMNTVASVVFGTDIDCYGEVESEFEKRGKGLISLSRFLMTKFMPGVAGTLNIKMIDPEAEKFFMGLCKQIVEQRKNAKQEVRDVLGNLIAVSQENPEMSTDILYKTCLQFFTDGYESASQVISVLIHHLTFNQDVQEKIQDEIDAVFENKGDDAELEQEDLINLTYLDQVIAEGLRIGMIPNTARSCTKPWKVPGDNLVIPVGMHVIIPAGGLASDPKYWTDPLKFDPERFSAENRGKFDSIVYQPFGAGPRACIGQNLVKLEIKVMLIEMLRNYSLKPFGPLTEDREWDKDVFIGFKNVPMTLVRRS